MFWKKCLALLLALVTMLCVTACDEDKGNSTNPGNQSGFVVEGDGATNQETVESIKTTYEVNYTEKDLTTSWEDSAESITLSNQDISITKSGTYVLSGTLEDGQIVVNVSGEETVHLVLNGVNITCKDSAPIYVKEAKKVILTLVNGTTNIVTDGESYTYDNAEKEEPNAAIFSKGDLTINGEGTLVVNANFNNGIGGKDKLKIISGTITVNAANNGIKGKDCVAVKNGNITVTAGGNGIQSDNEEDTEKGFILIEDGTIAVTAEQDGIEAVTGVAVTGGSITVKTGGGSENSSSNSGNNDFWGSWGGFDGGNSSSKETTSAKGLKADNEIKIAGGTITVDSSDDSMHTNGNLTIGGGTITLTSGDDGVHADTALTVTGGILNVTKSYEGLEAVKITIDGGKIYVVASDDGLNANGGNDGSAMGGRPGQNNFNDSATDSGIVINNGYIVIDASGDGIDSNSTLTFNGGSTIVYGPTNSGNGALDAGSTISVTGGTLLAVGSSGMASYPSSNASTQPAFAANVSVSADVLVHIQDEEGNAIFTFAPLKNIQSIVFSSGALNKGTTYEIYTGGSYSVEAVDGIYTGGTYSGGSKATSITLSNMVTSAGGSGGGMGGGGMGGGPGGGRR